MLSKGLVEVFTGDGKGKTSAALGIALRALGHDLRVFIVYFMEGDSPTENRRSYLNYNSVTFAKFG